VTLGIAMKATRSPWSASAKGSPLTPSQLRRLDVKQGWLAIGGLSQDPRKRAREKALAPAELK